MGRPVTVLVSLFRVLTCSVGTQSAPTVSQSSHASSLPGIPISVWARSIFLELVQASERKGGDLCRWWYCDGDASTMLKRGGPSASCFGLSWVVLRQVCWVSKVLRESRAQSLK